MPLTFDDLVRRKAERDAAEQKGLVRRSDVLEESRREWRTQRNCLADEDIATYVHHDLHVRDCSLCRRDTNVVRAAATAGRAPLALAQKVDGVVAAAVPVSWPGRAHAAARAAPWPGRTALAGVLLASAAAAVYAVKSGVRARELDELINQFGLNEPFAARLSAAGRSTARLDLSVQPGTVRAVFVDWGDSARGGSPGGERVYSDSATTKTGDGRLFLPPVTHDYGAVTGSGLRTAITVRVVPAQPARAGQLAGINLTPRREIWVRPTGLVLDPPEPVASLGAPSRDTVAPRSAERVGAILSPTDGEIVGGSGVVRARVTVPGTYAAVLVQPGRVGTYWVQNDIVSVTAAGDLTIRASYGGEDTFYVYVGVTSDPALFTPGEYSTRPSADGAGRPVRYIGPVAVQRIHP